MIENRLVILKWILIYTVAMWVIILPSMLISRLRGKKSSLFCPKCGGRKFDYVSANHELKDQKPYRKYEPVRYHISCDGSITVSAFMRDTVIWPYKMYVVCKKCNHRVDTQMGNAQPVVNQRIYCPKCKSKNYSRNMTESNIHDLKIERLAVSGRWVETCPDCGYSETHSFHELFSPSDIPARKSTQSAHSNTSPVAASKPKRGKWVPKRFVIYVGGRQYTLKQNSMYSEIDYDDQNGERWERLNGEFVKR